MKFYVYPKGWGVAIEADQEATFWLREFLRTKRITPSEEHIVIDLYDQLTEALGMKF